MFLATSEGDNQYTPLTQGQSKSVWVCPAGLDNDELLQQIPYAQFPHLPALSAVSDSSRRIRDEFD